MIKNETVFLFPGQGAQYVGMGKELNEKFKETNIIFECGSDILGFDLKKICFDGNAPELNRTLYAQPAIYAVSLCALKSAENSGISASSAAGHSLGEYAALTALGCFDHENGFRLIKARSAAMEKAANNPVKGSMCAVMGIDSKEISRICENANGYVVPVNYNSPLQTVIAGETETLEKLIPVFSEAGAKTVKLNVASAFHSKLMQGARDEFLSEIRSVPLKQLENAFYSNVTGTRITEITHEYLAEHMVSPVRFTEEIYSMNSDGIINYIELGPGKILSGFVKRTLPEAGIYNIENIKSLDRVKDKS